jgi:hypothetical protein
MPRITGESPHHEARFLPHIGHCSGERMMEEPKNKKRRLLASAS